MKIIKLPETKGDVDSEFFKLLPDNVSVVSAKVVRAFSRQPSEGRFGLLEPVPEAYSVNNRARSRNAVITNEHFPEFLEIFGIDEGGASLDREIALRLAASSVIAYQSLLRWNRGLPDYIKEQRGHESRRPERLPRYSNFWGKESYDVSTDPPAVNSHAVLHRMAARVVLNALNMGELDYSAPAPYPPHIAALADPFNDFEVKIIHGITKQKIKE